MNKNYKENLIKRNEKRTKNSSSAKSTISRRNTTLLDFLINDLGFNRTKAKSLLKNHCVSIGGAPISQFDTPVLKGDEIIISKDQIKKRNVDKLPVIFEDGEFLVLDKPYGILSVASDKERALTMYRKGMDYVQSLNKKNRLYIVHRIDKETSGVLMFLKNKELAELFTSQRNDIITKRKYIAIVEGKLDKKSDTIINYLAMNNLNLMYVTSPSDKKGRKCITSYKVIKENDKYSMLEVEINTGRKNQIRVTFGSIGHYVVGDDKYGNPSNPENRLMLHNQVLEFIHPISNKKMKFYAKTPATFDKIMK